MKTTLNPFENAKRTAQGTGGVSPSVIEEIQAEISVLGSQNETQTQDIADIKAQLEELAGAYSTTAHKTGRKWTDGRDVYEKVIHFNSGTSISTSGTSIETSSDIVNVLHAVAIVNNAGYAPIQIGVLEGTVTAYAVKSDLTGITDIIVEYTKTGA